MCPLVSLFPNLESPFWPRLEEDSVQSVETLQGPNKCSLNSVIPALTHALENKFDGCILLKAVKPSMTEFVLVIVFVTLVDVFIFDFLQKPVSKICLD